MTKNQKQLIDTISNLASYVWDTVEELGEIHKRLEDLAEELETTIEESEER